jgi:hypothetical protein
MCPPIWLSGTHLDYERSKVKEGEWDLSGHTTQILYQELDLHLQKEPKLESEKPIN